VVTVILADFRGFDTMGEITVIGIALVGVAMLLGLSGEWRRALDDGASGEVTARREEGHAATGTEGRANWDKPGTIMTQAIARLLLLPILMTAAAVLVKGYADTGDGFAAAVIAAFGVLLQYVAFGYRVAGRVRLARWMPLVSASGLLLALLVAFVPSLLGAAPLTHAPAPGEPAVHLGTLEMHTAVLFDVGVFLLVFGFAVGAIDLFARLSVRQSDGGQP
jgi:multisubunit Na+/H+ antiporter MnhB subunit